MARALLLGANSPIGLDLLRRPPPGWSFEGAGRTDPRPWGARLSHFQPLDLTDAEGVRALLQGTEAEVWINLACQGGAPLSGGRAPAPGAEPAPTDPAWRINAELPGWLATEARRRGRYLIHLSSDEVFDGREGPYAEDEPPSPRSTSLSWVGYAQGVGEARVFASDGLRAILRVCRPYGARHPARPDWVLQRWQDLARGAPGPLGPEETFTPTFVPDVALTLAALLERRPSRLYHVASPELISSSQAARLLLAGSGRGAFGPTFRGDPSGPRRRGGLRIREIHKLDVRPLSFREGLRSLRDPLTPVARASVR